METHVKVHVGEAIPGELPRSFDLRQELRTELHQPDPAAAKKFGESPVQELALAIQKARDAVGWEERTADDRVQVAADGEVGVPGDQSSKALGAREVHVGRNAADRAEGDALLDGAGDAFRETIAVGVDDQVAHESPRSSAR